MTVNNCRGSRCRLLVADDNEEFLLPFRMLLEAAGCAVDCANSAAEVLELAKAHAFEGVILDIRLPDLSGYTIVRQLRMLPAYARIPIIGMTGWHSQDAETTAREAGFDHLLLKPVNFEQLENILNRSVCRAR